MDVKETPILTVENLKMYFPVQKSRFSDRPGFVKAVDDVSFSIPAGQTFGIVGESGCGKTTIGRCILGIYRPSGGQIFYGNQNLTAMRRKERENLNREIQLVFQDPYSSLDPRHLVRDIIREAIAPNGSNLSSGEMQEKIEELIELVGLNTEVIAKYPHEMSGGQRQRAGIARALACNPKLLVCDEPISALDVSIQAQIVNLFAELQEKLGLTYVFIAHDLAVVRHISTRIAVMYLGRIVEITDSEIL